MRLPGGGATPDLPGVDTLPLPFPEVASRPGGPDRAALLARWLDLTRVVLPGMAVREGWPISLDHCVMRVCLDAAVGARWDRIVPRPAIRYLSDAQLAAAVAVAEGIAADPARLPALNDASLRLRRGR